MPDCHGETYGTCFVSLIRHIRRKGADRIIGHG